MSRKEPTHIGLMPKDRPEPPPGPHWFQKGDRNRSEPPFFVDKDAPDVISVEIPCDLVILVVSEGLKGMIERFHQAHCSDPPVKKGP